MARGHMVPPSGVSCVLPLLPDPTFSVPQRESKLRTASLSLEMGPSPWVKWVSPPSGEAGAPRTKGWDLTLLPRPGPELPPAPTGPGGCGARTSCFIQKLSPVRVVEGEGEERAQPPTPSPPH